MREGVSYQDLKWQLRMCVGHWYTMCFTFGLLGHALSGLRLHGAAMHRALSAAIEEDNGEPARNNLVEKPMRFNAQPDTDVVGYSDIGRIHAFGIPLEEFGSPRGDAACDTPTGLEGE
ncbi:hypothetical protein BDN71DRAFT_1428668 [Pleurotus eryngii]|uniref:Uncharacterized protein n=1 Tax=Pleurotus eryngii TaxID=5323 RepID=A0A9P6A466_PLEER|nr:hypothetical protein BDN71DRAFT_1428668 [Pleurotus eryngii]